jgi:hypothetical protein
LTSPPKLNPQYYVPLNTQVGDQYAYIWALPPSLAAGYYFTLLLIKRDRLINIEERLQFACWFSGSLLLLLAFYSTLTAETLGTDQLLGSPAYFFITLSLAQAIELLTEVRRRALRFTAFLFLAFLIMTNVAIGSNTPDRAVDVHQKVFEPHTSRWSLGVFLTTFMAPNPIVTMSKDVTVPTELSLKYESIGIRHISPSYKDIRNLLLSLESGEPSLGQFKCMFFALNAVHYPNIKLKAMSEADIIYVEGKYLIAKVKDSY